MTPLATRLCALAAALTVLGGCASTPDGLAVADPVGTSFQHWSQERAIDAPARWGGAVSGAFETDDVRCLVIDAYPLDRNAYPRKVGVAQGEFAACDPALDFSTHSIGQNVTVVGTVRSLDIVPDSPDGPLPAVVAETVYGWNDGNAYAARHHDSFGRPVMNSPGLVALRQGPHFPEIRDKREPFSQAILLHQRTQFDGDN